MIWVFAGRQPARTSRGCLHRDATLSAVVTLALHCVAFALRGANTRFALAGFALRANQFALLNRMRNTDIFFMGVQKLPTRILKKNM